MLPSFASETVIVVHPAQKSQRGTTVPDWVNAQRHVVTGCIVQLPSTSMDLDGRTQTELSGTLYAPCGSGIRAGDHIEWTDGEGVSHTLAVDGEPMPWRSPTGRVSHVQARIAEWKG